MDYLRAYLRSRLPAAGVLALFAFIFALTFRLYHLPVGAALYPALVCAVLGAVLLVLDYLKKAAVHRELTRLQNLASAEIDRLPLPSGPEAEDYQALIASLRRELRELETRAGERYRNTVDYYTVWAHQIKTPITSMRLTLEQEDSPLSRKLTSDLREIERYVEMVLAYLRLDSDSSDYVFREVPLDDILGETLAQYAGEFIDRHLKLDYSPTGVTVVTDTKWLSFVIGQVLSNALKYTREGSVTVRLEATRTLLIQDTGLGIAEADLPRVFDRGYTGLNGRLDRRSSGLGLWLCKRVCDRLGVAISIASAPGQGTEVRLDLAQYELKTE